MKQTFPLVVLLALVAVVISLPRSQSVAGSFPQPQVTATNVVQLHKKWTNSVFEFNQVCRDYRLNAATASLHGAKCALLGLDPVKTRAFEVACVEEGIDPAKTTMWQITCTRLGLDPKTAKVSDLKKFGYKE